MQRDQSFSVRRSKQKSLESCFGSISDFLSVFLGKVSMWRSVRGTGGSPPPDVNGHRVQTNKPSNSGFLSDFAQIIKTNSTF